MRRCARHETKACFPIGGGSKTSLPISLGGCHAVRQRGPARPRRQAERNRHVLKPMLPVIAGLALFSLQADAGSDARPLCYPSNVSATAVKEHREQIGKR